MKTIWYLRPLDTLLFRDGTSFEAGEQKTAKPQTYFPPFMSTLQGAIRIALASTQGWHENAPDTWPEEIGDYISLGQLQLKGPYLLYQGEPLFPAPLRLFGAEQGEGKWELHRLVPGPPVECDLGEAICLPRIRYSSEEANPKGDILQVWLTAQGYRSLLQDELPDSEDIQVSSSLWSMEQKYGIKRDLETQVVEDKHLYRIEYIRPHPELQIAVEVDGIPDHWELPATLGIPLGGEGKYVEATIETTASSVTDVLQLSHDFFSQVTDGIIRFTVSLLTPGYYADLSQVMRQGPAGIPGRLVSALLGKLQTMAAWESTHPQTAQKIWRQYPVLPAGSTWFYEASADQIGPIIQLHLTCTGEKATYGMGQIAIGIWNDKEET
ncbi:type III-B CRISPR module-associated Cmr3 family protein [Thermoflavimicrobium dichotomicum]|uniref:CRISPR-associated protein Cmr3 n=1 Tax=Thermoflavimicrobium dichotomicum TaxID=46223 RepID=A0A1I3USA0_9BACL|nr:type III-B CRISPR module-associated Cmr3 family protein [Thermoflavimicrobium dichotomicum]SFJ85629.1 CRISPR-associated protein Cmr3 [Thermoflavimicrobium dichotomicum]